MEQSFLFVDKIREHLDQVVNPLPLHTVLAEYLIDSIQRDELVFLACHQSKGVFNID